MDETTRKNRSAAYRMLAVEVGITAVLTLLLYIGVDIVSAWSAALGGLAYIVPNAYFTKYVFRHSAAESAALAVRGLYIGEALKVLGTVLIFGACFVFIRSLNVAALFLTYLLMLIVNLRGIFVLFNR